MNSHWPGWAIRVPCYCDHLTMRSSRALIAQIARMNDAVC